MSARRTISRVASSLGLPSRLALVICGLATVAISAMPTPAADGVTLRVDKGPGAGDITLDWTGGQPMFDVYRAPGAPGVVAPPNFVTSTSVRTLVTGLGTETIAFFVITTPCVIDLPERCDGVDNDCDGTIDEAGAEASCVLPNASSACVAGACAVGSCDPGYADCDGGAPNGCEVAMAGFPSDPQNCGGCNIVCPGGANATASCSASTCGLVCDANYADCNNLPGDGCEVNSASFATDSYNCGGCGIVCTLPNAIGVCSAGSCQTAIASCDAGYFDQNADPNDGCEYACTPTGSDLPDDAFADANCDGIDGDIAAAIFASPTGNDADPGTMDLPVQTLAVAFSVASGAGKSQVYADEGFYVGAVQLVDGISLYGAYKRSNGWARSVGSQSTIMSATVVNNAVRGLYGVAITSPTTVDRIRVITSNVTGASGRNNYAFHCNTCPAITLKNAYLSPGNGGTGTPGTPGNSGTNGSSGNPGTIGNRDANVSAPGGPGGSSSCGRTGGNGGAGRYAQLNGLPGAPGTGGTPGGNGGNWGDPGQHGQIGANGISGLTGADGAGGPGGSGTGVVGDNWVGVAGSTGTTGPHGNAGGGGGGGGGQYCTFCDNGTGSGGGGGGGGGCAGLPGTGGGAGGGSFGAFFIDSIGFTLENSVVFSSNGGQGGAGAPGGSGGSGGNGGAGGVIGGFEVGNGGNGGIGGMGATGGRGGGGSGGASYSVYRDPSSSGTITGCTLTNGAGGAGGTASGGNVGGVGASGTIYP